MNNIELSVAHILGFIYLAFAHQTDGILTKEEQAEVWKKVRTRTKQEYPYVRFAQIMDEITHIYKLRMNDENIFELVLDLADELNNLPWFNHKQRILCLTDLKDIALSDAKFILEEKHWLKEIAKIWKIDNRSLQKIEK
jgi:hypothetical protein